MMVAKPSKVYTKLQGNVGKMNVRLSSQFSHELLKLSNFHFVNIFLSIHFHHIYVIQYTDLFTLTITKLYLVYFFMFMGTLGQNCHFNFHSKESSSQLKFHYREFKTIFIQNQRSSIAKGPN